MWNKFPYNQSDVVWDSGCLILSLNALNCKTGTVQNCHYSYKSVILLSHWPVHNYCQLIKCYRTLKFIGEDFSINCYL